jgi:hypothetical protein
MVLLEVTENADMRQSERAPSAQGHADPWTAQGIQPRFLRYSLCGEQRDEQYKQGPVWLRIGRILTRYMLAAARDDCEREP